MNRWWGSATDSQKQAAERSQRQARRTISQLPLVLSSDEDNFEDCDTSIADAPIFNLDGQADTESVASDLSDMDAAELARQRALPFEEADFENDPEAWKKEVKIKYDPRDVEFWFNSVEAQMKKFGINKQWDKKDAIIPLLPDNVVEECKQLERCYAGQGS